MAQKFKITPADERISLAVGYLSDAANNLSQIRLRLQIESNANIPNLMAIEHQIDNAIDMLENGY